VTLQTRVQHTTVILLLQYFLVSHSFAWQFSSRVSSVSYYRGFKFKVIERSFVVSDIPSIAFLFFTKSFEFFPVIICTSVAAVY